jgi:DNA-binding XRE family transcriptional regulator
MGVKKMDNEKTNELISLFKEINSSLKVISTVAIKESGISKDTFNAIEKNKPFYLKVWELLK